MENSNGKVIGALLLGAAIGGVLGILFAPDKGSETRKKIMANSDELTDAVKEKLKKFLEQVESATEKATECIENGIEKV